MLAIEIEYLTGVAYAANDRGDGPDWPPQPDRLFSALVASWAARGEQPKERCALEWLEQQAPPRIAAPEAEARTVVKVFAPPNDDSSSSLTILPTRRKRQERRFPAAVPHGSVVRFGWDTEPDEPVIRALDALARDTSYLGHSASLVRCHVITINDLGDTRAARRGLYRGRLADLERAFAAKERPKPGEVVIRAEPTAIAAAKSSFGADWIVFSNADGTPPDPVAAAIAAKTLIKTVQAGYGEGLAPAWVSGHAPDGTPLSIPHLAAVPLLDVGWTWSQGRMMGLALILPRALEAASRRARDPNADRIAPDDEAATLEEAGLFQALAKQNVGGPGALKLTLHLPGMGGFWTVAREATPSPASLKSWRYLAPSRTWASLTPIALDRHPKAAGDREAIIADACTRIGLPRPEKIVTSPHSAVTGAVSVQSGRRSPAWTGWQLPRALAGRRLTHAVISFAEPVGGPVILGAGRFAGLGLCLRLDGEDRA
jgi:CRISPR-associated protein Csb2